MSETPATATEEAGLVQRLSAEVLGTFVLVLVGCGTAVVSGDYLSTGLAFGLAFAVMIYAVGRVSGGHFNPAVSVGAAVAGRISWLEAARYVGAQVGGAVAGALVLLVLLQGIPGFRFGDPIGANGFGDAGSGYAWWAAFLAELVLTGLFVLVILAVTDRRNEHPGMAPLAIGLTLTAIHLVSMGLTGTSVNPARSIGPALFSGDLDLVLQLWLFILAPLAGAVLVGLLYSVVFGSGDAPVPGSGLRLGLPRRAAAPGYGAPDQLQQQWNQQGWQQPGHYYPGQPYPGPQQPGQQYPGQPYPGQQWQAAPEPHAWQQPPMPQPGKPDEPPPESSDGPDWDDGEDGRTQIRPPEGGS